jgi:hypothetical protein
LTNKFKIEYVDIDEIKEYKNNPRINDAAIKIVADSITAYGFTVPIVVDKKMEVIAGHTRLKASHALKLKQVPIIRRPDLSEAQVKAFRILDNKSSEYASWDFSLLEKELKALGNASENAFTGFDSSKIDFLPDVKPDKEPEIVPEMIVVIKIDPKKFEEIRKDLIVLKEKYDTGFEINFSG